MKRRKSGETYRREKMIMIACGVLVLTAVSVTGISIYQSSRPKEQEENIVDFSVLENEEGQSDSAQAQNSDVQNYTSSNDVGELDYDPYYVQQDAVLNGARRESEEESSSDAASQENADTSGTEALEESSDADDSADRNVGYSEVTTVNGNSIVEETADLATDAAEQIALEAVANAIKEEQNLHFDEASRLVWPVVGNVVLNYSMDKTVYFQTLQQYKYNPSIVISAVQGASISCAADGMVKSVYEDPQTGTTVVMNLGNGYELSYGQLTSLSVEEGDFVEAGAFIGKVAAPTKYYTKEGTNVYFKLTKDQEPVNPLDYLGS